MLCRCSAWCAAADWQGLQGEGSQSRRGTMPRPRSLVNQSSEWCAPLPWCWAYHRMQAAGTRTGVKMHDLQQPAVVSERL